MMKTNNHIIARMMWALIASLALTACNPTDEICRDSHPHTANLAFKWSFAENPESFYVLADKPLFHRWYGFVLQSIPNDFQAFGRTLYPTRSNHSKITVAKGTYNMVSMSEDDKSYTYNLSDYSGGTSSNFDALTLTLKRYKEKNSDPAFAPFTNLPTHNTEEGEYLYPKNEQIFYSKIENVAIEEPLNKLTFSERQILTQRLNIEFLIKKETTNIVIDTVCYSLSGVPYTMNVITQEVKIDNTATRLFFHKVQDNGALELKLNHYVHILGIVPPNNVPIPADQKLSGPGILYLDIVYHTTDEYLDNNMQMQTHKRFARSTAAINLYSFLKTNGSLESKYQNGKYTQTRKELTISIEKSILLKENGIANRGDGFNDWRFEGYTQGTTSDDAGTDAH